MTRSPFAPFKNAVLTFQVASNRLVTDADGFKRPGTAIIEVEALLQQKRDPNRTNEPGTPSSKIWLEGYLVAVVGAPASQSLELPTVITPDSACSAVWQGRTGRFFMEFTAKNPYLDSLNIDIVNRIRGYFEPGSFVVAGDSWFDRFA